MMVVLVLMVGALLHHAGIHSALSRASALCSVSCNRVGGAFALLRAHESSVFDASTRTTFDLVC